MTTTINYDHNCVFTTKSGWKVIFPTISQDDDREFNQAYEAAINSAKDEIMKHAEMMSASASKYVVGQWSKAVNSSFSKETKKLHDLVMGNNGCDELMFRLEVIDERTIKVA